MATKSPEQQLAGFLARFRPEIANLGMAAVERLRQRLPGAVQLVYDNYNALVIGFGPSERASEAVLSVAFYAKRVNLFFLRGADLPDPHHLLQGDGRQVRHITLADAADLDRPAVRKLLDLAVAGAVAPMKRPADGRLVIRSISQKQRPRRLQ